MAIPFRGITGHGTYFITASTFQKKQIFQSMRMADMFLETLRHYQTQKRYLLHEFVVMPDHFHVLITPNETLERSLQLIKGGFSFRAKRELGFGAEIWQNSYFDRRVRDVEEYQRYREYIRDNPVKRLLSATPELYRHSSAARYDFLDSAPQGLKPL